MRAPSWPLYSLPPACRKQITSAGLAEVRLTLFGSKASEVAFVMSPMVLVAFASAMMMVVFCRLEGQVE